MIRILPILMTWNKSYDEESDGDALVSLSEEMIKKSPTCFFFNLAICDSALAISLSTLEIFCRRSSLVLLTSSLSAVLSSGVGLIASTWGW